MLGIKILAEEAREESYQCKDRLHTHIKANKTFVASSKDKERGVTKHLLKVKHMVFDDEERMLTDLFFCPTKSKIVNLPELVCSAKGHKKTVQDALGVPSPTRFLLESRGQ